MFPRSQNPPSNTDNSGTIEYLRIEYASYGVTLLSVGSGTTIDHIQTSFIANNAFEFLGGTVDAKNLISTMQRAMIFFLRMATEV